MSTTVVFSTTETVLIGNVTSLLLLWWINYCHSFPDSNGLIQWTYRLNLALIVSCQNSWSCHIIGVRSCGCPITGIQFQRLVLIEYLYLDTLAIRMSITWVFKCFLLINVPYRFHNFWKSLLTFRSREVLKRLFWTRNLLLIPLISNWTLCRTISNGKRTEWSPNRSVIIHLLITSMITDRIGRHEVLLPINHKNYNFREKKNSQVMEDRKNLH